MSEKRKRTEVVGVRMTPRERRIVERAASRNGDSLSGLIRRVALKAAQDKTRRSGRSGRSRECQRERQ